MLAAGNVSYDDELSIRLGDFEAWIDIADSADSADDAASAVSPFPTGRWSPPSWASSLFNQALQAHAAMITADLSFDEESSAGPARFPTRAF